MAAFKPYWNRWLSRRIPVAASVRLNQRRIFIIPSQVGLAFMVALLLMLLAAINYQNSLAYALTFLLSSVFVVAILHTYRNLAGLILKAGAAPAVFAGEPATFRVRLESSARASGRQSGLATGGFANPGCTGHWAGRMPTEPADNPAWLVATRPFARGEPFPAGYSGGLELGRSRSAGAGLSPAVGR